MMNFLIFLGNAVFNFLILNIVFLHAYPQDPNYWIGAGLAFTSGLGLRVFGDIRKNKFTIKGSLIQFFTGLFLSFAAVRVKEDFTPNVKIEYYVFICALSSTFILDVIDRSIKIGFTTYARLLLTKAVNILKVANEEAIQISSEDVTAKKLKGDDEL